MADLEQQVMQLTQDLYVLKHTTIAGKTVEEWIIESNTIPEDAMIKEEDHKNYIDFEEYLKLKKENKELKEAMRELNNYNIYRIQENAKLKKENEELKEYKSMYEGLCK